MIARFTPYGDPKKKVGFSFDWSFTYFPLDYERPGPEITIYQLNNGENEDGKCGTRDSPLASLVSKKAAAEAKAAEGVQQDPAATGSDTAVEDVESGDSPADLAP